AGRHRRHSKEFSFTFPAKRDGFGVASVEFAAASADGFTAWMNFFDVYSDTDDVTHEEEPSKTTAAWGPPPPHHHAPPSPSAPKLVDESLEASSPPADAPSAPSVALSPSAQVAFEVGHGGFAGLDEGGKKNTTKKLTIDPPDHPPSHHLQNIVAAPPPPPTTPTTSKEEEEKEARRVCILCCDGPQNAVCVPCGHNAICMQCAENVLGSTCPVCRQHIRELVRIYKG
ncbi:hypothetical protein DYB35_009287, partial [Aphanomyces astaci]